MRRAIAPLLFAFAAVSLWGQPADLAGVIDFSISTADLVELVQAGRYELIDPERYLILQGQVASTLLLDPNEATYQALVELVDSKWEGLTSISVYRLYVLLEGPEFSNRVVDPLPRDPGDEIILANSELLVIGAFIGVADAPDGSLMPVVQAVAVR